MSASSTPKPALGPAREHLLLPGSQQTETSSYPGSARRKWGEALNAGFQIIPNVLLRCQRFLGLDAIDLVILLNIAMHWWDIDDLPYPRPSVIARRMSVSTRTVERRIVKLQALGLITRLASEQNNGQTVRRYILTGLVERLVEFSNKNLAGRNPWSEAPLE